MANPIIGLLFSHPTSSGLGRALIATKIGRQLLIALVPTDRAAPTDLWRPQPNLTYPKNWADNAHALYCSPVTRQLQLRSQNVTYRVEIIQDCRSRFKSLAQEQTISVEKQWKRTITCKTFDSELLIGADPGSNFCFSESGSRNLFLSRCRQ
jgi:hypothetical protein